MSITEYVNVSAYPLDKPGSDAWNQLVTRSQAALAKTGLFDLPGFINEKAIELAMSEIEGLLANDTFTHQRSHNIYFKDTVEGLSDDHPALRKFVTTNHTLCADQIPQSLIIKLYEWPEFATFLAAVMDKPQIYTMADPIARVNVMEYRDGEALNWHFDRSEFTITLLLQTPKAGGVFEYCRDLRSDTNPNYDGVSRLIDGTEPTTLLPQTPGTLNVFRGTNTAHRVTPIEGDVQRIVAVLSYYDEPGVAFSAEEQRGFFGREA